MCPRDDNRTRLYPALSFVVAPYLKALRWSIGSLAPIPSLSDQLSSPCHFARSVRNLIPWPDSGRAAVVSHQSAQPLAATHVGAPERADLWCDQLVAEPLMVPLPMVVRHELVDGAEQPTFPEAARRRPSAPSWASSAR